MSLRRATALPMTDAMIFYLQALTITSVLIHIQLKIGIILLALRCWRLRPGASC